MTKGWRAAVSRIVTIFQMGDKMVDAVTRIPRERRRATKLINKTVGIYIRANISLEIYPSYSCTRRRAMPPSPSISRAPRRGLAVR